MTFDHLQPQGSTPPYTANEAAIIADIDWESRMCALRGAVEHGDQLRSKWPLATDLDDAILRGMLAVHLGIIARGDEDSVSVEDDVLTRDIYAQIVIAMNNVLCWEHYSEYRQAVYFLDSQFELDAIGCAWNEFCDSFAGDERRRQVIDCLTKWQPHVKEHFQVGTTRRAVGSLYGIV